MDKDRSEGAKDDICRDYLRNVCHRGKGCKYRHPEEDEAKNLGKKEEVKFCHDYQNGECIRRSCKFVHCTKQEEEYYKTSGRMPDNIPICKDFLKGECTRSSRCKFRHVPSSKRSWEPSFADDMFPYSRFDDGFEPREKRYAYDRFPQYPPPIPDYYLRLEDENKLLLEQVSDLKKQVSNLAATNEFLLEQNAKLHITKEGPAPQSNAQHSDWQSGPAPINDQPNWQNGYNNNNWR